MTVEPINKILPSFIESLRTKGRSPATILAYRADIDQLIAFLVDKNKVMADQVKKEDIESFRDWLLMQKYTPKSVSRKLNAVKTFFRWLVTQKTLVIYRLSKFAHPKTEFSLPNFLSALEYSALRERL